MKQLGLRKILNEELSQRKYLSIEEVHKIARSEGHRESNAERRLRQSESPYALPVRSQSPPRAILGYRWIGEQPKVQIQQFNQGSMKLI
jgi:hypothetical protein